MRATRAYAASIGTTGVLIVCALLMLALVSAIVAFNGWPGSAIPDRIENVLVGDDEPEFALAGPDQVAADAAPAAAAVAAAPLPAAGSPESGVSVLPGIDAPPPPADSVDPGDGGPVPPVTPIDPPTIVTDPPVAQVPPVTPLVDGLVDTTTGVVAPIGDQLGLPIGDPVSDTGGAVGEIVDELTRSTNGRLAP